MTTKWKIIMGFIAMILLTGIVAAIGYFSLSGATDAFTGYRSMARLNVHTSDILVNQYASMAAVRLFRIDGEPKLMEEARSAIRDNMGFIKASRNYTQRKDILDVLDATEKRAIAQLELLDLLEKNLLAFRGEFTNVSQPIVRTSGAILVEMSKVVSGGGNVKCAETLNALAYLRSSYSRFAYRPTQEDGNRVTELMANLTKAINELGAGLNTDAERAVFAKLQKNHDDMAKSINVMLALASDLEKANTALMAMNADVRTAITSISTLSNDLMTAEGTRTLGQNAASQSSMLAVTAIGLILGALLAAFIIIGLVRVLRNMSAFADAIANGDFHAQVNSREKGEIGHMLTAMRHIPQVLEKLITVMKASSGKIVVGDYRNRLDAASFSGDFNTLAQAVNDTCDAYTKTLDQIPLAIIACDLNFRMLYINDVAKAVLGGDKTGANCGECFKAPTCNTDKCFARNAKNSGRPFTGETPIYPASGNNLEITVTAIPLNDMAGVLRGHMEICTDISAMKAKERTIASVTGQAASISNRVAAAAEELSAQVEQISRGAEMQRSRVESTASAMTEMNSTVLEVARNAGQASEQSELTKTKANDGDALVGKVVQSINLVNKVASTLQTNMRELGTQADNIGGVMNVISDIADQTNLLALNAAIEAARAGEAGRGFAVVADEVRKLAEKTMSATQEVGATITAIQNSAHTNISEVNTAADAISEATSLSSTSGQALAEIVDLASANSAVVTSIATAAEEQSATSEEINRAIEEINKIVGETTDGMMQSSAAVQELSRMAQELNKVMAELA